MEAELKALVALAETGSMERAANDLYLTPSALTRRIQRLEIELEVVLLDRHFLLLGLAGGARTTGRRLQSHASVGRRPAGDPSATP